MWSVLRRLQGEEYEAEERPAGITANLNHIAAHECRPNQNHVPEHLLTEPYARNVYPKLVRTLEDPESTTELRHKALEAMNNLFGQKHEHVFQSVAHGVVAPLVNCLKDSKYEIRALAGAALTSVVATEVGLATVLDKGYEIAIVAAVEDAEPSVAVAALSCLAAMDHAVGENHGTKALIKAGCISTYIKKANDKAPVVQEHALTALAKIFHVKEAYIQVLDEGVMDVLVKLLESSHPRVQERACETLSLLGFFSAGKRACVKLGVLRPLRELICHDAADVRRSASGAAMAVTVDNEGKQQALDYGVVASIIQRLHTEGDDSTVTNMLRIICNCSESPKARAAFREILPTLRNIADNAQTQLLKNSAKRAVHMVEWKPGMPIEPVA